MNRNIKKSSSSLKRSQSRNKVQERPNELMRRTDNKAYIKMDKRKNTCVYHCNSC